MAGLANSRVVLRPEVAPELTEAQERPAWFEQIGASFRMTEDDVDTVQEKRRFDAYIELERDLVAMGEKRENLRHKPMPLFGVINLPVTDSATPDTDAIWAAVQRQRRADPTRFSGMPATQKEFEAWVLNRRGGRERDRNIVDEGGSVTAGLIGGIAGSFTDPFNVLTLPIGGGGKTVASVALREGLLNAGLELYQQGDLKTSREARGEELTTGEAAMNVVTAGLGGALLGGGFKWAGDNWGSIKALPKDAQEAIWSKIVPLLPENMRPAIQGFDDIPDSLLPQITRALVGEGNMTGDLRAAAASIERAGEDMAASPFRPTPRGDDLHLDLMAKAMQDVLDGVPPSPRPMVSAPDLRASTAIASGTVSTRPARDTLKARIGRVENASGSATARPLDAQGRPLSSALGKYQFTEGTWTALYKRRFGSEGLSDTQIAAKRTNSALQDLLMDDLLEANARILSRSGQAETAGNLYLAHFAGPEGAVKLLEADGRTMARDVLGDAAVKANPFLSRMSAADVVAWAHRKMGEDMPAGAMARASLDSDDVALQAVLDGLDAEAARLDRELMEAAGDPDAPNSARVEAAMAVEPVPVARVELDPPEELAPAMRMEAASDSAPPPEPSAPPPPPAPRLSAEATALLPQVKAAIEDARRPSLNPAKLAKSLNANERDVFAALSELVRNGGGVFQTAGRGAAPRFQRYPANAGPVDALTFIARMGGVRDGVQEGRWDGVGPNLRKGYAVKGKWRAGRGIDRFVPGAGTLIRDSGRSLDELGEMLDEAGYLRTRDPAQLALGNTRPTVDEVEEFLVDLVENKRAVYAREDDGIARALEEDSDAPAFDEEFAHHIGTAAERMGIELTAGDIALAQKLYTGDFDETLIRMMHQQFDDANIGVFVEDDIDGGPAYEWEMAFDGQRGQGAESAPGGRRRTPDAGDAGPGAPDIEELRSAEFSRLGLDRLNEETSLQAFSEPDGPGVDAQIESIGHDLEMMFDPPARAEGESMLQEQAGKPGDGGHGADPTISARQRQKAQLRADSPLQGGAKTGQAQDGVMGLGLFDAADQPSFRLDPEGGTRGYDDIIKALDEEDADIAAARACTQPKKGKPE